jgi:uncharacterized protein (TIGR02284 family)
MTVCWTSARDHITPRSIEEGFMGEQTKRAVLDQLIETCKDGERGFLYATNYVHDPLIKAIFTEAASQRQRFAVDLLPHAQRLGGENEAAGTTTAALHRGWMTIKDTLSGHDAQAIIREAERGEEAALAAYEDALEEMLPPTTRDVIERQYADVRRTHDRIHTFLSREIRESSKA